MKFIKSDWTILKEAENKGFVVAMTGILTQKRTYLNDNLRDYFRTKMPNYTGSFDEYYGEDVLDGINDYIKKNNINKHLLDFPFTSGTDIHLIPITANLQLKILIVDEYHGDGDYSKYVEIDYFVINESTSKEDVDRLIEFIKEYVTV